MTGGRRMKSRTKNLLSNEKIRELVMIHFGKGCEISEIEELKGGMFNAIYKMKRVKEQDEIVLKVGVVPGTPLLTYEQDVMPTEVACFQMVEAQTNVPVPKILAYDFSKKHLAGNYYFMTAMKGVTLLSVMKKIDKGNLERIREEMADYLWQMHQIKGPYFGYFTEDKTKQYDTWEKAFFAMFEQLFEDGKTHGTKLPYQRIRKALEKNAVYLREVKKPALVEYDCHEGNIFVKEINGEYRIEGILDLERAFWGDPAADFPAAFIFTDDIRKEKAFLNAYMKKAGMTCFGPADVKRDQLYRMYILSVMTAEVFRYDYLYGKLQSLWARHGIKKCLKELEK